MLNIDLHCHSHVSDGALSPTEVITRAANHKVDVVALTDHDDVSGLAEAGAAAKKWGIVFIPGVEISVTWRGRTIHIVGLRIDPLHPSLVTGLQGVRNGRHLRARHIGDDLARHGLPGAYEGARGYAVNSQIIGRVHFARWLVDQGCVPDVRAAFKRYLTRGKPGYVEHEWTSLENAVNWIRASGGMAVLAHPGRYDLTAHDLHLLLDAFRNLGGEGLEVVTGSHHPSEYGKYADLARAFGLKASCGTDFHAPGESAEFGSLAHLPHYCRLVWQNWPEVSQLQVHS